MSEEQSIDRIPPSYVDVVQPGARIVELPQQERRALPTPLLDRIASLCRHMADVATKVQQERRRPDHDVATSRAEQSILELSGAIETALADFRDEGTRQRMPLP